MWAEILRHAPQFDSAVLSFLGEDGFPYSTRVLAEPDAAAGWLSLQVPEHTPIERGKAGLLFHSHDENLWNIQSFVLTGRLERERGGWIFQPRRFVPGMGVHGLRGYLRFVISGRRTARQFLASRGLEKPFIDWQGLKGWLETARDE